MIRLLISDFASITFEHIFPEVNSQADFLSNMAIRPIDGRIYYEEYLEHCVVD